jgi:uncharacterized protein with gpF-like domain
MPALRRKKNKSNVVLRPIHPNAGIEAEYRRRLDALIQEMHDSVLYWVRAAYRANEPEMAQDDLSAAALRGAIGPLTKRWLKGFNDAAPKLADWFSQAAGQRSDAALEKTLKDGGFSVEFKMTRAQQDVMRATINQQVGLIKSIPQQYLGQVEGMVMRAVQTGRDVGGLAKEIEEQFGVTKRRAKLIARSQNNLATASMTRARQIELGIEEAIWLHSGGGHRPRPSHVKAGRDKQVYSVKDGWYDPDEKKNIWPGQLINCRCVHKSIVKGLND